VTFEAFGVVVVPFPFTDRTAVRRRPALVVSSRAFNASHAQVVLAMITSAVHAGWPSDMPIRGLGSAGLRAASVVRLKLFTLDQHHVLREIGSLAPGDAKNLRTLFGRWLL
jgi:mRNA interferase MazF